MELLKRLVTVSVSSLMGQIEASVSMNKRPKSRAIDWNEKKRARFRDLVDILKIESKITSAMFELDLVLEEKRNYSAKARSPGIYMLRSF